MPRPPLPTQRCLDCGYVGPRAEFIFWKRLQARCLACMRDHVRRRSQAERQARRDAQLPSAPAETAPRKAARAYTLSLTQREAEGLLAMLQLVPVDASGVRAVLLGKLDRLLYGASPRPKGGVWHPASQLADLS